MKKTKNKFAKVAAISGMCALGSLSANAFGVDVDIHANPEQGIGASVDADVGLARANVGANVGTSGVDAGVGADVVGAGANTAAHVGFDGVKARANTYAWNVANVGANAGVTWKDGAYVGGTARFLEPANTAQVAVQNGQVIQMPVQPAPQNCQWVYANNGRIVGYKPLPLHQRVMAAPVAYAQPAPVVYAQPAATVVYAQTAAPAAYTTVQRPAHYAVTEQPVRVVRRVVRRPVEVAPVEAATEIKFSHERDEQTRNGSSYQKNDFYQLNDPANGYRLTDKRQFTRTVTRRTVYSR